MGIISHGLYAIIFAPGKFLPWCNLWSSLSYIPIYCLLCIVFNLIDQAKDGYAAYVSARNYKMRMRS